MFKRIVSFCFLAVLAISLSGCVTFGRKNALEVQGLRNQISVLEVQVQSKDQEISSLKNELDRAIGQKVVSSKEAIRSKAIKNKAVVEAKSHPKARQIQTALKNAGYNPGKIDGRMGSQTVEAIKAFQTANNIPADGKVGKGTWKILREYLIQKTK